MTLDWLHLGTLILTIHVLGIVAAFHAIMNTRTSQGAIAWAVSLAAMPYLTLVPYLVLGRSKFSGYVDARRHELEMLRMHTPASTEARRASTRASRWARPCCPSHTPVPRPWTCSWPQR